MAPVKSVVSPTIIPVVSAAAILQNSMRSPTGMAHALSLPVTGMASRSILIWSSCQRNDALPEVVARTGGTAFLSLGMGDLAFVGSPLSSVETESGRCAGILAGGVTAWCECAGVATGEKLS